MKNEAVQLHPATELSHWMNPTNRKPNFQPHIVETGTRNSNNHPRGSPNL